MWRRRASDLYVIELTTGQAQGSIKTDKKEVSLFKASSFEEVDWSCEYFEICQLTRERSDGERNYLRALHDANVIIRGNANSSERILKVTGSLHRPISINEYLWNFSSCAPFFCQSAFIFAFACPVFFMAKEVLWKVFFDITFVTWVFVRCTMSSNPSITHKAEVNPKFNFFYRICVPRKDFQNLFTLFFPQFIVEHQSRLCWNLNKMQRVR